MAFLCNECGRTWPRSRNKTPDVDDRDICHECYEESEPESVDIGQSHYPGFSGPTG